MQNKKKLKNSKKTLRIILWVAFIVVVLGGTAFASWYYLINPETRAGGANDVIRVKLTAKSQEWWATSAYQIGGENKKSAAAVWNIAKRDPDNRVISLRQALDRGLITGYDQNNHNLDEFKFALYERTRDLEVDVPRSQDTYSVGKIATAHENGTILTHADDVVALAKFPGTDYKKGYAPSGFTIWNVTSNKSDIKPKLSYSDPETNWYHDGSYFKYDDRAERKPFYNAASGNDVNKNTWISTGRMVNVEYTGGNAVTIDHKNGTNIEITKAYKDLGGSYRWNQRQGLKERENYNKPNQDFKNDKVVLEFKAKNTKSNPNIVKGENLFVIPTLSPNGTEEDWNNDPGYNKSGATYATTFDDESSPAEYRFDKEIGSAGYTYAKNKNFYNLLRVSPQTFVTGIYRAGTYPTPGDNGRDYEYIAEGLNSHFVSDMVGGFVTDPAKMAKMKDFLKHYPENFGAWQNPGTGNDAIAEKFRVSNTSFSFDSGGLSGKIYPVAVVPASLEPAGGWSIDDYVRFVWALRIDDNNTKKVTFSKNTNTQAIRNLLRPYRTAISVMSLNDYIFRGNYGYNRVTKKLNTIASADITSDPLNEIAPGEFDEAGRKTDTTKAVLINDEQDVKITWDWKNSVEPQSYKVYRDKTEDFTPNDSNKIADNLTVLEYIDLNAPTFKQGGKDNYYWYRVVSVYEGSKTSLPSRAVQPSSAIKEDGPDDPEGTPPLKPTDVDAFGMNKQIELSWKSASDVASLNSGDKSGLQTLSSRKFKIYRTVKEPEDPQEELQASGFLSFLIKPALAAETAKTNSDWPLLTPKGVNLSPNEDGKYIYMDDFAKSLKNGRKYWYRVKEVNKYGDSPFSDFDGDIPHVDEDVNKDGFVNWIDVTRVLIYPAARGTNVTNRDVTEDVNHDRRVDWKDIYGASGKKGVLKYVKFPEIGPTSELSK